MSYYANTDDLKGKTVVSVSLSPTKDALTIETTEGTFRYGVEGDCCSTSWIEHATIPADVAGAQILDVDEQTMGDKCRDNDPEHDCLQVYETRFRTNRGDVVMEYRNSSNGYYGGYLVGGRLDP